MHTAVESFSIHSCHDVVFMLVSSLQDAVTYVTIITCKGIVYELSVTLAIVHKNYQILNLRFLEAQNLMWV